MTDLKHLSPKVNDAAAPAELPAEAPVRSALNLEGEHMPRMTLIEHLDELRRRLIYAGLGMVVALAACLAVGRQILALVEAPFAAAMQGLGISPQLAVLSVTGVFTTYLRISLYAALVLASPWIIYQLWSFVAAGLYRHERRYVRLAMPISLTLFLLGAIFAVILSVPAIQFFITFGKDLGIQAIITLNDYVAFMTQLVLAFGLVFQVPLVVLVLAKVGLVNRQSLSHYRRHVIVGLTAVAAFLAPPDVLSMLAMMLPMWLLYELGIVLASVWVFKPRQK